MSGVATAIAGAGVIGAGASLAGAKKQAKASKNAANMQYQMFNDLRQQQQPFIQSGYGANTELMRLLGIGGDSGSSGYGSLLKPFTADEFSQYQDPGYAFRKQQGEQSVLNSAGAGSGALSGAALKDLLTFNSGLASEEYGNAFNRYQTQQGNIFSRLAGIANMGQNAAANVGSQGTALAGNAGQAIANAGTALGGGIVGAGNALGQSATDAILFSKLFGKNMTAPSVSG